MFKRLLLSCGLLMLATSQVLASTITWTVVARSAGVPTAGLTPTWSTLVKVSDGTAIANPNTAVPITALAGGGYKLSYDAEGANGPLFGIIDFGNTITDPNERYAEIYLTIDGSRIATNLDAAVSSRHAAGVDTPGTTALQLALAPYSSTVNDGASTTTVVDSALTGTADLTGSKVVFTSGALKGVYRTIASINGTNGQITLLTALPSAPANGAAFSIVQGSKALEQFLAALGSDNRPKISADAHTAGASVLVQTGTGTGQINVSAGKVPATVATGDYGVPGSGFYANQPSATGGGLNTNQANQLAALYGLLDPAGVALQSPVYRFSSAAFGNHPNVTVGGYASGQEPETRVWADPHGKAVASYVKGRYSYNPSTGLFTLYDADTDSALFSFTLTQSTPPTGFAGKVTTGRTRGQ